MNTNKSKMPLSIREAATKGDRLLFEITKDLFPKERRSGSIRGNAFNYINSNQCISTWHPRFKEKWTTKKARIKNPGKIGDLVEAYIWFLNVNYGYETAKRYALRNITRHYIENFGDM